MKNCLSLLFAFALFTSLAFAQVQKPADNFELKGTVSSSKTRVLWLRYVLSNEKQVAFKTIVKNGAFTFKGYIPGPLYAEFYFDDLPEARRGLGLHPIFLSPGKMSVSPLIENQPEKSKITGSVMQNDWDKLEVQKAPLQKEMSMDTWSKIKSEEKQVDYKFIAAHPASYLSPYLIDYYFDGLKELRLDSADMFYNTLSPEIKDSFAAKLLANKIAKHKASATDGIAPLFAEKDINGKVVALKSFRDKNYVLLYFWASWALFKSTEDAKLKTMYNKYHPAGLEIVALSQDFFQRDWKKAIRSKGLGTWHNISITYNAKILDAYNLEGMPPTVAVLIDKQGKVVGRYFGEHPTWQRANDNEEDFPDLEKKLAEVFDK